MRGKRFIVYVSILVYMFSMLCVIALAKPVKKVNRGIARVNKGVNSKTVSIKNNKKYTSYSSRDNKLTIILDVGHGGKNRGAYHYGVAEKDINLDFVKLLKSDLEKQGFKVVLTRETDKEIELDERVELLNKLQGDIIISIHHNASVYKDKDGREKIATNKRGFEVYYPLQEYCVGDRYEKSKKLASLMANEMKSVKFIKSSKMLVNDFRVLRKTNKPSILLEIGYMTNREELKCLTDNSNKKELSLRIVKVLNEYRGIYK
ncbi:MAG: N-acetylmuramoyl-L-alanine amidase [Candidatus Anstonellales archaeon]